MAGTAGATGLVNGADVTGATGDVKPIGVDVGSEILRGRGNRSRLGSWGRFRKIEWVRNRGGRRKIKWCSNWGGCRNI